MRAPSQETVSSVLAASFRHTISRPANAGAHARLVGLNSRHEVVFDFEYGNRGCGVSWNAIPVPLEAVRFH